MIDIYDPVYLIATAFFIIGLERMGNPRTAVSGILWAGIAMALAIGVTFFYPALSNFPLIFIGVAIGSSLGWVAARRVAITDMPQMVAIYNGMGAGAAAAIAAIELLRVTGTPFELTVAAFGAAIGSVSIAGSLVAFLKLQGLISQRPVIFPMQQVINLIILFFAAFFAFLYLYRGSSFGLVDPVFPFFILSVLYGILMSLPIGGADMPVVIAMFNAMTGLAVALDGYAISNYAMVVAGILVGAAGSILTYAMAKAMNRSLGNVLFSGFGKPQESTVDVRGSLKPIDSDDAAIMLAYSNRVVIVPGFGMAAAQAQFKVKELLETLRARGIKVSFAIHPVAGRMPGHMNVLLAEANISYDLMIEIDEANREFEAVDVSLVIGANDVVNPSARRPGSSLYGMPILDVDKSKNIIVMKRGAGKGFAGIENELFYRPNTRMLYGDAQEALTKLIVALKKI